MALGTANFPTMRAKLSWCVCAGNEWLRAARADVMRISILISVGKQLCALLFVFRRLYWI